MQFRTDKIERDMKSHAGNSVNGFNDTVRKPRSSSSHSAKDMFVMGTASESAMVFRSSKTGEAVSQFSEQETEKLEAFSSVSFSSVQTKKADLFSLFDLRSISISKTLIINLIAIIGLVYAITTIYSINERSKLAFEQRLEARLAVEQAQYDIPVVKASASAADRSELAPSRIEINKIGVNALIDEMGVTADNNIEAPATNYTAGWFNQSSVLNESGATIIDGHLGSNIEPGIFWNLEDIEEGDTITLYAKNGEEAHYVVRETEVVDRNGTNFDKYYSPIGDGNGLNIITCSGGYLQHEATYDSRLIVYAEQVYS